MKILFIADPLSTFKIYKDSTFAMMREASKRGFSIYHTLSQDLAVKAGIVGTNASHVKLTGKDDLWFETDQIRPLPLADFDAVIMRTDPPFDMQYLYATQLLSIAEQQGVRVFNSGQAMRDLNEKLAILNFSEFTTNTIVATKQSDIVQFLVQEKDIIVKPLDGMGGSGIFRLREGDPNLGSVLEMLMNHEQRTIMAQRYIPDIVNGDKRVLVIDGEPIPFVLARIPQVGETRGNLAAGGRGVAQPISPRELEIAQTLGPILKAKGVFLAGLDVIGDFLTEVNVTSPTCFQEITDQTGFDVAVHFMDALMKNINA
ncbi:glutathione synthase [Neisseria sp. Ec49-e6-T10]|uniref:glutathione synthase n=1 Tax=Neisseria sp. Ec49-e6-T10 TaxID=3140744 RepID=UPI003EB696E9